MKFFKKFADWKTWVFIVLPILLFVAWLAILIYAYKNSINNPALIIFAQALFTISILLMFCLGTFKKLTLTGRIASIVFSVCFVALQVATMFLFPTLCDLNDKEKNLSDTLFEMTSDDPEYEQTHEAWREAAFELSDVSFTIRMLYGASLCAVALASICAKSKKEEAAELTEQNADNGNDNNSDSEQQA